MNEKKDKLKRKTRRKKQIENDLPCFDSLFPCLACKTKKSEFMERIARLYY